LIFPSYFNNEGTVWILSTYGGIALLTTLIGFLVSFKYVSEKPFFNYLYKNVYEYINQTEDLFLEYSAYVKTKKEFNKSGGLFTRFCNVKVRRYVKGYNEDQEPFDIYDTTLTTSNGKSQQVHFDGTYYVFKKALHTNVQIRTNGSPKLKGIKFNKVESISECKVYKIENEEINNTDYQLIDLYNRIKMSDNVKRVYIGVYNQEVHVAIWYRKYPARKLKSMTVDSLNQVLQYFMSELDLIKQLSQFE